MPEKFSNRSLKQLFQKMVGGGRFSLMKIKHFFCQAYSHHLLFVIFSDHLVLIYVLLLQIHHRHLPVIHKYKNVTVTEIINIKFLIKPEMDLD